MGQRFYENKNIISMLLTGGDLERKKKDKKKF